MKDYQMKLPRKRKWGVGPWSPLSGAGRPKEGSRLSIQSEQSVVKTIRRMGPRIARMGTDAEWRDARCKLGSAGGTSATAGREPCRPKAQATKTKRGRESGGGNGRNSAFIRSRSNNANQGQSRRIKVKSEKIPADSSPSRRVRNPRMDADFLIT